MRLIISAWLTALLLAVPLAAQTFPAFTGLVVDAAGVLSPDREAALAAKLETLQQQTGRQLVVATVPDLQGYPIEDYGYRLGRHWGVGLKDADNGAILLVAPKERRVRIEVGRRLEPIVTDALSSVIIQSRVLPAFKAGDMADGIEAGADAIAEQLRLPDADARRRAEQAAVAFDREHRRSADAGAGGSAVFFFVVIIAGIFVASRFAGRRGRRYARRGGLGGDWPIWLWAASDIARGLGESRDRGGGWGGFSSGGGGGGSDGSWFGGGFTGGGGGDFGGGGASGEW